MKRAIVKHKKQAMIERKKNLRLILFKSLRRKKDVTRKRKTKELPKGKEECLAPSRSDCCSRNPEAQRALHAEKIMHKMIRKYCPLFDSYKKVFLDCSFEIFKIVDVERAAEITTAAERVVVRLKAKLTEEKDTKEKRKAAKAATQPTNLQRPTFDD